MRITWGAVWQGRVLAERDGGQGSSEKTGLPEGCPPVHVGWVTQVTCVRCQKPTSLQTWSHQGCTLGYKTAHLLEFHDVDMAQARLQLDLPAQLLWPQAQLLPPTCSTRRSQQRQQHLVSVHFKGGVRTPGTLLSQEGPT